MTISKWTAAGIALAILLVGYGAGRFTTPAKLVESEKLVSFDRDTELSWRAYVGRVETKTVEKTKWQTITKWEPGGVVTQTVQAQRDTQEEQAHTTTESEGRLQEKIVYRDIVKEKLVESRKPDWLLGAGVGLTLDHERLYRIGVGRRILGPIFLELSGQYPTAGMVELKVLF
jgi:hypothetical protein